jgi:hypothetical protein
VIKVYCSVCARTFGFSDKPLHIFQNHKQF